MGAWGVNPFENDAAQDWARALEEARGATFLRRTLMEAIDAPEHDLEAESAARALAACEVVAVLRGEGGDGLPEEVEAWIEERRGRREKDLSDLALQALERVREDSQLAGQWREGPDADPWLAVLADLERRLTI